MNTKSHLKAVKTGLTCVIDGERPALIPEGIYEGVYIKRDLWRFHGGPKLSLQFRIVTMGDAFETALYRHYPVQRFSKRSGTFKVGWKSDFVREYGRLFGLPRSLKSIGTAPFESCIVKLRVQTVTSDYRQDPIPEEQCYSKVAQLLEVVT